MTTAPPNGWSRRASKIPSSGSPDLGIRGNGHMMMLEKTILKSLLFFVAGNKITFDNTAYRPRLNTATSSPESTGASGWIEYECADQRATPQR
jgi:hypothetical protein